MRPTTRRVHKPKTYMVLPDHKLDIIFGSGEPTTFGLWARRAARLLHPATTSREYYGLTGV